VSRDDSDLIAEIERLEASATPREWKLWRGPLYAGGGEDICVGAGETWLMNMDHRAGPDYQSRVDHDSCGCELDACDICSVGAAVTREQVANAELIVALRNAAPTLLRLARKGLEGDAERLQGGAGDE